jgi:hypothetical protein
MVSVLASSAVDRGFKPQSVQAKDYESIIYCFSAKHAALRRKLNLSALVSKYRTSNCKEFTLLEKKYTVI